MVFCENAAGDFVTPWSYIRLKILTKIGQLVALTTVSIITHQMDGLIPVHLRLGSLNYSYHPYAIIMEKMLP